MVKKELFIDKVVEIKSYTQHAYVNAIVNRKMIADIYIDGFVKEDWQIVCNDIDLEIIDNDHRVILSEKKGRKCTSFMLERACGIKDQLIIKLNDINLTDSLSNVKVDIVTKVKYNKEINSFVSFYWNQYDITLENDKYTYPDYLSAYYMIKKDNVGVYFYISYDKMNWRYIGEKLKTVADLEEVFYRVEVYFGENQYEKWLNMNYLQLFFNKKDSNGVYLDYFMFSRKGIDASYNHACQFIDTEYVDYYLLRETKKFNVRTYIENSIMNGYYLCISLNEYYIYDREAYNSISYEHYNLIFGFDSELKEYSILGYNKAGKIVCNTIPYEILEKAIRGKILIRYRYNVNKYPFKFNIDYLKEMINEFLDGRDSSLRYSNILTYVDGQYGIKIFEELLDENKSFFLFLDDDRISYLLYEHAWLNKRRLDYLISEGYLCVGKEDDLQRKASDILKTAERVKNLVIKNRYKKQTELLKNNLVLLRDMERNYFIALLQCL